MTALDRAQARYKAALEAAKRAPKGQRMRAQARLELITIELLRVERAAQGKKAA